MSKDGHIAYWLEEAAHDLETAESLFQSKKYDFHLEVRYPDYKQKFYECCTQEYTEPYFTKIKEFYQWLKSQIA